MKTANRYQQIDISGRHSSEGWNPVNIFEQSEAISSPNTSKLTPQNCFSNGVCL